jgi:hypothetical protein
MKRYLTFIAAVALVLVVGGLAYSLLVVTSREPPPLNGGAVLQAAQHYAADLRKQGLALPATVTAQELARRGFLNPADLRGFDGVEITLNLRADENRPQDILARARLADGSEIFALGDGSVQQVRK